MIKDVGPHTAISITHYSKNELLELLSERLGCKPDEVGFLFQGKDMLPPLKELMIPDGRSTL